MECQIFIECFYSLLIFFLYSRSIIPFLLFIASSSGHIEVVKELFNRNSDIESKDKDGKTPLILGIFKYY
jgi:ankyrin repeat protein